MALHRGLLRPYPAGIPQRQTPAAEGKTAIAQFPVGVGCGRVRAGLSVEYTPTPPRASSWMVLYWAAAALHRGLLRPYPAGIPQRQTPAAEGKTAIVQFPVGVG